MTDTINLDAGRTGTGSRPPVISPRAVGQTVRAMVIDKDVRARLDRQGTPTLNSKGKPASEEVLTVMILDGTTAQVSGGDDDDDWTPEVGTVCRLIFAGKKWGLLIDARNAGIGRREATQVGDIVVVDCPTATIWRGPGDVFANGVTEPDRLTKARTKGLTVGYDWQVTYRRPSDDERAAYIADAVRLHKAARAAAVDVPVLDDLDAF